MVRQFSLETGLPPSLRDFLRETKQSTKIIGENGVISISISISIYLSSLPPILTLTLSFSLCTYLRSNFEKTLKIKMFLKTKNYIT